MSTSGARYHIPFPSNFLSLNARTTKTTGNTTTSPQVEAPAHSFLSNRPHHVARHGSVSSVSSAGTNSSVPSSPPTTAADVTATPAVPTTTTHSFLALNTKHTPKPTTDASLAASPGSPGGHSFLSNRV